MGARQIKAALLTAGVLAGLVATIMAIALYPGVGLMAVVGGAISLFVAVVYNLILLELGD